MTGCGLAAPEEGISMGKAAPFIRRKESAVSLQQVTLWHLGELMSAYQF